MSAVANKYPRIAAKDAPVECSIKRFCVPIKIFDKCPKCGVAVSRDLGIHGLSYPTLNAVNDISFEHYPDEEDDDAAPCGAHWIVSIRLTLTAALATAEAPCPAR